MPRENTTLGALADCVSTTEFLQNAEDRAFKKMAAIGHILQIFNLVILPLTISYKVKNAAN